jgi:hypothetical protein
VAERGLFKSLTNINYALGLCEVKSGASFWSLTEQLTQLQIQLSYSSSRH